MFIRTLFEKCYVHNIFTTNSSWQLLLVLIYILLKLFFCPPITIYHLRFVMKVLRTCCEHNIFHNFLFNLQWTKILEKSNFIFNGQILFRMFMIFLGWSSFFSKLSTTYINLEFLFFLSIIFFFPKLRVVLWPPSIIHGTASVYVQHKLMKSDTSYNRFYLSNENVEK